VVVVESLRLDQLEAFGGRKGVMPNLDSLAQSSLRFSNVYSQASHSSLADPCIFSSQYPLGRDSGLYRDDALYPKVLIYDVLKAIGYRTAIISSQNETWGNMLTYLDTGSLDLILHSETYDGPTYVPRARNFLAWIKGEKRAGKIDDRYTVTEAIRWISQDEEPFFAYLNLQNSHVPYEIPADYPRRFSHGKQKPDFTFSRVTASQIDVAKDFYADSLNYVDHQLGRLIDHLRQTGALERTVLVVTGDTGQGFMEHGFFTHSSELYDEVMRVPLIVSVPDTAGRADSRLAQHIDIPPTILTLLALPAHPAFQGEPLVGREPHPHKEVYLMVKTNLASQQALVTEHYKLLYSDQQDLSKLYDLRDDPAERHDIARQSPRVLKRLQTRLGTYRRLQFRYYADPEKLGRHYAPILAPPD